MAGVQKPASDKAKGTLYGAINADGSFGIFDSWSHVGGQRFRKVEYSPLSPASCGKLKSWAAARDAAIEWLLHECDADRRAAVQRVRDSLALSWLCVLPAADSRAGLLSARHVHGDAA